MSIDEDCQLHVLLALLRLRGLWQADSCHNPALHNTYGAKNALTPLYTASVYRGTPTQHRPFTMSHVAFSTSSLMSS